MPINLSSALCRPTSSQTCCSLPSGALHAAACMPPVRRLSGCNVARLLSAARIAGTETGAPAGTAGSALNTCSRLSTPHKPHPVRPVMLRLRCLSFKNAWPDISQCTVMPSWTLFHFRTAKLGAVLHDAFAQRKAQRKTFQITGRRQHHRVRDIIEFQRDRHLDCQTDPALASNADRASAIWPDG